MQDVERIREILEMIVCPACYGRLELAPITRTARAMGTPEVNEGKIQCVECERRYPIEEGIPVLLVERASRES